MIKKCVGVILFFLITFSAVANTIDDSLRYQRTQFVIYNNTDFPVAFTIVGEDGRFEIPVQNNTPMVLNPNERYQNTLISLKKDQGWENFASMEVAEIGNARENYLIYAENASSKEKSVSADIVDGLGDLFVDSTMNQCDGTSKEGYAVCELRVIDHSKGL